MRPFTASLFTLISCMILIIVPNYASPGNDPCEVRLIGKSTEKSVYQRRKNDERCEGILPEVLVSETLGIELVSLHLGRLHYDLGKNDSLYVSIPEVSPALVSEPIRIRAVGRREGTDYRMDAFLPKDRPFKWPLRTVLYPQGLEADDIGVFGWLEDSSGRIYIPLNVSAERVTHTSIAAAPIYMIVRVPVDVDRMVWRSRVDRKEWPTFKELGIGYLFGGQWASLQLPSGASGLLQVQVQAHSPSLGDWIHLNVRIIRPGM